MKHADYVAAAEVFRRAIGTGPLQATLLATALALEESRSALKWSGHPDDELLKELKAMQQRLEALSGAAPDSR